jgi:hypothetical protein
MTNQANFFEILGNLKEGAEENGLVSNDTAYQEFINDLNKLPKLLELANAVIEETGVDIENNDIEHQLGNVWVGNISISGIELEE